MPVRKRTLFVCIRLFPKRMFNTEGRRDCPVVSQTRPVRSFCSFVFVCVRLCSSAMVIRLAHLFTNTPCSFVFVSRSFVFVYVRSFALTDRRSVCEHAVFGCGRLYSFTGAWVAMGLLANTSKRARTETNTNDSPPLMQSRACKYNS